MKISWAGEGDIVGEPHPSKQGLKLVSFPAIALPRDIVGEPHPSKQGLKHAR